MPSTRAEWTGMVQSLRRVKCQIVSAGVPMGTLKSRRSSPEAELRWAQELEGGGVFWAWDSVPAGRIAASSGLDLGNHSSRRSCRQEE